VLWLLVGGLLLRIVAQPLVSLSDWPVWRMAMVLSGALELAGLTMGLLMLVQTSHGDPPVRGRRGLWQVLPFLTAAFGAAWLALPQTWQGQSLPRPRAG
jgi:hypothetical protein